MKRYDITGMRCAACAAKVEKAVSKIDGVSECSVNLLTNSMGVKGTAAEKDIIAAVKKAGFGASLQTGENKAGGGRDVLKDVQTPVLKKRLAASVGFLAVLTYFSTGYTARGWPVPSFFEKNPLAVGLLQLLLAAIVMVINQSFFISGFKAVVNGSPNMDTLVSLGSAASFGYGVYALFAMSDRFAAGDPAGGAAYLHELYFESAAMILALITVGKTLEARSKGKTTDALKSLMTLAPKTANLLIDGKETSVPISEVKKGDVFVVRPGESVPADGTVLEGSTAIDESALTGESIPIDKTVGDEVSSATINKSGYIKCRARRVGEDSTISQIIKMVGDAAATKAPIAKIADKVAGIFAPVVITIAIIAAAGWLIAGESFGFALERGISVLVISCPCALGLATPVAITVGSGKGAKNGVLFKTAESLETAGRISAAALDKTGTITKGEPRATDLVPAEGVSEEELLKLAFSLEKKSEHPLAKAVVAKAEEKKTGFFEVSDFKALPGNGLSAVSDGSEIYAGSVKFISETSKIDPRLNEAASRLSEEGKTPMLFARNGEAVGVIAVADVIKEDAAKAVSELRGMGIRTVMLTGDNKKTAAAIGKAAGVDEVIAEVSPAGKADAVRSLKRYGKVAMVGDGINDAPALTQADLGIAIGAGTDAAIDAADVVLMKNVARDVPAAIRLGRATLRNIRENLFWAFIYNSIGIPLAAGAFIRVLGWKLNPIFGAAAMSLSSFCVVSNALRLNFLKMYDSRRDGKIKKRVSAKKS